MVLLMQKTREKKQTTITFELPIPLKNAFKAKVSDKGKQIKWVLCEFVETYVSNKKEDKNN